jgi:hypothetical protein
MDLRTALTTLHTDRQWWGKILIGGALMMTIIGYPWAAGMVMESFDNTRKGFPSPLPPWRGWSTRYVLGFLTLLIDFVFFVMPAFVVGLLFFCVAVALVATAGDGGLGWLPPVIGGLLMVYELTMFAIGAAPIARLIFVDKGGVEEALGMRPVREALRPGARGVYAQARLRSLPVYLPATLFGLLSWLVAGSLFPGAWLVTLLLLWLASSALLYAHLVTVQLYSAADRSVGYSRADAFGARRRGGHI